MTSRVQQVHVPLWTVDELRRIPDVGLPLLNASVDDGLIELFTAEALGSPHLVQEFFRELCLRAGLLETSDVPVDVRPQPSATALLGDIAQHLSRPVFDALAQGPRQRSDRIPRPFRDGRTGDIYHAVLNAIAQLKPGMGTLSYEQIRSALRELLIDLPQAHEVSRVLEHMSTIQADQEASAPVLDWDKRNRCLHITDPYLAFFLKWGADVFAVEYVVPVASATQSLPPPTRAKSGNRVPAKPSAQGLAGAHASDAGVRATGVGVRSKKSDADAPSAGDTLNANERAVLGCLSAVNGPLTLFALAERAFPELPPEKANSWVRNSVRKPLRLGLIARAGSGAYSLRKAPKR
ncbi:hypothetical protein WMF28_01180 [Sorangium sp. So ce590]|uniref:hypothetical protein n=1 Tax=Sorangium sp. So ce590 TaxID=3133317 RepID=UPI003F5F1962